MIQGKVKRENRGQCLPVGTQNSKRKRIRDYKGLSNPRHFSQKLVSFVEKDVVF